MNIGFSGSAGEKYACKMLTKKGYKILSRNFQTRFGEIDIVCRDNDYIVFVEVKTRSQQYVGSGREAVNYSKQSKIIKAAVQYLQQNPLELQPRFDVVEVTTINGACSAEHIVNAFDAGGRYEFV